VKAEFLLCVDPALGFPAHHLLSLVAVYESDRFLAEGSSPKSFEPDGVAEVHYWDEFVVPLSETREDAFQLRLRKSGII
jgi:hypothetical protein